MTETSLEEIDRLAWPPTTRIKVLCGEEISGHPSLPSLKADEVCEAAPISTNGYIIWPDGSPGVVVTVRDFKEYFRAVT